MDLFTTAVRPLGPAAAALDSSKPRALSFGQSAVIHARFAWASADDIRSALDQFCNVTGRSDPASVQTLSQQQLHHYQVQAFRLLTRRLGMTGREDDRGRALRLFDQAQVLHGLLQDRFDGPAALPPLVAEVYREAAEGLFILGESQFRHLKSLIVTLSDWIARQGFKSVVLVESPLGNCVPVQVLGDLCRRRALPVKVVEWGFPRNDRSALGRTLKNAAEAFAKEADVGTADCVLFLDDVLTGTRFRKLAGALRRTVGAERFAAVAMRFQFAPETGRAPYPRHNLDKVAEWGRAMGLADPVVEFPALPVMTIDGGAPAYFETAVAWTDQDVVAGKRKINLLFETIDKYRQIFTALSTPGDPIRLVLQAVWSVDTTGARWAFTPGLIDDVFDRIGQTGRSEAIFRKVWEAAIAAFPADHLGQRHALTETEVRRRTDWLQDCLWAPAKVALGERGGMVANAILALHHAGAGPPGRPRNRDHDYGHYTIAWRPEILALNRRLRELILAA